MPYKRQNEPVRKYYTRKYNTETQIKNKSKTMPRKRISFEKKLLIQGIVSVVLLIYSVGISKADGFVGQKQFIHKAVNINATKQDAQSALKKISQIAKKGTAYANDGIDYIERLCTRFFEKEDKTAVTALAMQQEEEETHLQQAEEENKQPPTPEETANAKQGFVWPVKGEITSNFGERVHPVNGNNSSHMGLDIGADYGTTVVACGEGVVSEAGYDDNLGNYVKVKHSDTVVTVYGHLSKISVKPDEAVSEKIKIGEVGETGMATGPHLHLEVRVNGVCMNPVDYLVPYGTDE